MNVSLQTSSHFRPSSRLSAIGVSEILRLTGLATDLKRQGKDVIILGTGEPDFDTPAHVKDAAARHARRRDEIYRARRYARAQIRHPRQIPPRQRPRLRSGRDHGLKRCEAGSLQCNDGDPRPGRHPGDEVIIPTPFWVSYADIVLIAGGKPVLVPCSEANGFRLSAGDLEAAITPCTRWVMLNSPSNPTGAAYSAADHQPLLDVLLRQPRVWLIADDIYEHIVSDDFRFVTPAAIEPALRDRILTVNGLSKAYAMTGWRIGYVGGPRALIRAMAAVQSQSTSCPSSIRQAAAVEALNGPQDIVRNHCRSFQARRDLVVSALNEIKGITCRVPEGTFYTFASCAGLIGKKAPDGSIVESDMALAEYLLRTVSVAVVPGSAFGLAPYFRISYATSAAELEETRRRIATASAQLL